VTFRGTEDAERVRAVVAALQRQATREVAFVVPAGASWTLPVYELALQTANAAPTARLHVVTPEPEPLAGFGPAAARDMRRLLREHDIALHLSRSAEEVLDGRLWATSSWSLAVDQVVALPRLFGPHLRGLPSDPLGFVPADDFTRVLDAPGVYAVGDVAALAVKQGGLAAQQADVAAKLIARLAGADVLARPYRPVWRGMLLVEGEVRYLRHEQTDEGELSDEPLWWPAHKIAAPYLANFLAARPELVR
jgi:sulfide:quinone oxidoreductase